MWQSELLFLSFGFAVNILRYRKTMSQSRLTRNQSSLLRSSPTIRSSIHSLRDFDERGEENRSNRFNPNKTGSHLTRASLFFSQTGDSDVGESTTMFDIRRRCSVLRVAKHSGYQLNRNRNQKADFPNQTETGSPDTNEIGSIEDTTAMESSLGLKEVSIKDSTSKDLDMFTGSTPEIFTPVNGLTVKAMNLVSNMDLVLTTCDKHAGEYFRDKIHGFGVCHFPNGHYYEGAWHEGRKQRYGTYGFITGFLQKRVCFVKRFRYVYIIPESIRFGCKGGDFRKLLISAQEMARKGVDQRRVDEQVVRAVAAANKALDSC
ncbi:hypothetical protein HID58_026861 [Brassica napus]|uniref:Uncharacterized protein n=1 Tax=Brassica napus TaxID=3708 RepID=A0ABQ8CQ38_BRANA|nr:hypothetical protein HID58_026861 [Brassica napus]